MSEKILNDLKSENQRLKYLIGEKIGHPSVFQLLSAEVNRQLQEQKDQGDKEFMTDEDIEKLKDKIIYYESSRGCPFSCQYCLSSATVGVRFLNVRRVIDELKFFVGQKVKQVKFVDRTFNVNKKHFMPILKFNFSNNS